MRDSAIFLLRDSGIVGEPQFIGRGGNEPNDTQRLPDWKRLNNLGFLTAEGSGCKPVNWVSMRLNGQGGANRVDAGWGEISVSKQLLSWVSSDSRLEGSAEPQGDVNSQGSTRLCTDRV